jgi:purine-cytosine permease-like protein
VTTTATAGPGELPAEDQAFHVEQHGIDFIPETERWARPRDLAGLWAGASVNVEYFVYGAILMGFGFSFSQTLSLIVIGNLSWLLVGLCSLQGPDTGTTVFAINRASYGPQGSKFVAFFNWLTLLGFEVEGLILIVGAALVLSTKAGLHPGTPARLVFILLAVGVQILLPFLGHATMVKVLRWLIAPFVAIFLVLFAYSAGHAHLQVPASSSVDWQFYFVGLAFTITLTGLGWTECGNDYSRYLPRRASKGATVGWLFLGTAIPEALCMVLGALVFTFVGTGATWNGANPFQSLTAHSPIPGWFVVVFLAFAIVQLFGINSLDLYSSGVTLQALGLRWRRYQCVLLDSAICLVVTTYAVFNSHFSTYMKDFVDVVIVWIAPWCAIFLVDWWMRRSRYVAAELQDTTRTSLYWYSGGVNWSAIIAQLLGMAAAMSALSPTFHVADWMHEITVATGGPAGAAGGADFSVFTGLAVGGATYFLLARRSVARQRATQDAIFASDGSTT